MWTKIVVDSMSTATLMNAGARLIGGKRQRYLAKYGLTECEYKHLHQVMKKKILKPELCSVCLVVPPKDLANTGVYDYDTTHWFWACQSCHQRYDFKNGIRSKEKLRRSKHTPESRQKLRESRLGKTNPFLGKKHTLESRQKMRGPRPSISGVNNPNFGKKLSEEHIQKLRKPRENQLGEKNHFFNKKHSTQTKLRMVLARSNREAVKLMSISGRFSIPRQEWMDEVK